MVYDVDINREQMSALFDIKGPRSDVKNLLSSMFEKLPQDPNTLVYKKNKTLMFIGVEHWILRAAADEETVLRSKLDPELVPSNVSVVLISDSLVFFSINGINAKDIMKIASPLDFDLSIFKENYVTFSEVFGIRALIKRRDDGFEFGVDQSFGNMISDYLARTIKD